MKSGKARGRNDLASTHTTRTSPSATTAPSRVMTCLKRIDARPSGTGLSPASAALAAGGDPRRRGAAQGEQRHAEGEQADVSAFGEDGQQAGAQPEQHDPEHLADRHQPAAMIRDDTRERNVRPVGEERLHRGPLADPAADAL